MPIAVSVRRDFSSVAYRDAFFRLLATNDVTSVHVASGFFTNFVLKQNEISPDFSLSKGFEGKSIFLYGVHNRAEGGVPLRELRDMLRNEGIDAHAYAVRLRTHERDRSYKWHAKIAVFDGTDGPYAAITGSSNFTFPSMMGPSEVRFDGNRNPVNIESDVFLWKAANVDIAQAMHDAFNYWGRRAAAKIAFADAKHDDEIRPLIEYLLDAILCMDWEKLS